MTTADGMFSAEHMENEACGGCGVKPSVHMGHGSFSCRTCYDASWCKTCGYRLGKGHGCVTPEQHSKNQRELRRILEPDEYIADLERELTEARAVLERIVRIVRNNRTSNSESESVKNEVHGVCLEALAKVAT